MSFILSLAIFCATRGGFHGRGRNFGVSHATFGYGRPPRSVGPLGLAAEIVSIGYGPVPHRIWGPGAAGDYPSHVLKRRQDGDALSPDVTRSFPTTSSASHSSEKQLKLRKLWVFYIPFKL